jgi:hypothetical protein
VLSRVFHHGTTPKRVILIPLKMTAISGRSLRISWKAAHFVFLIQTDSSESEVDFLVDVIDIFLRDIDVP